MTLFGNILMWTAIVILIISVVWWIANDPSYKQTVVPESGIERIQWQAAHGNEWAKMVLVLMEERAMLAQIVLAGINLRQLTNIDDSSPEHAALDQALRNYHNHIRHTYKEED